MGILMYMLLIGHMSKILLMFTSMCVSSNLHAVASKITGVGIHCMCHVNSAITLVPSGLVKRSKEILCNTMSKPRFLQLVTRDTCTRLRSATAILCSCRAVCNCICMLRLVYLASLSARCIACICIACICIACMQAIDAMSC